MQKFCSTYYKIILYLLPFFIGMASLSAQTLDTDITEIERFFDTSLQDLLDVGMVSASQQEQSVLKAPATAYVLTSQQINERGYRNLLDLLEDIPEIDIQRNVSPDIRNVVSVRGVAGTEKLLILLDGFRVTPSTGDGYTIGHNFPLVDAVRVEVIIGPASALYGVDAFSGVVNIITQDESIKENRGRISSLFGNFTTTDNQLFLSFRADKMRVTLAAGGYFSAEPNYADEYPRTFGWYNNAFRNNGFIARSPQINFLDRYPFEQLTDFTGDSLTGEFSMPSYSRYIHPQVNFGDFTAGFFHSYERHSSAYGINPRYTAYESDAFVARSHQVAYFQHDYTSFNRRWNLRSKLSYNFYQINPESNFYGATSRWQRGYVYGNGQSVRLEEQFSYTFLNSLSLVGGLMAENLTALPRTPPVAKPVESGNLFQDQDLYLLGSRIHEPFFLPEESRGLVDIIETPVEPFYLTYQNYGGFLQAQYQPTSWLDLTLGGRYDYNTRFGGSINPRLGAVFSPSEKLTGKLLFGTSFLAPSPEKAFRQDGYVSNILYYSSGEMLLIFDNARLPNRDLQPEKLQAFEGSINYLLTENISLQVGAAHTRVTDLINQFATPDSLRLYEPTAFWRRYQNPLIDVEIYRLETSRNEGNLSSTSLTTNLNVRVPIGQWRLDAFLGYTWLTGTYNQPQFTGSSYFALFGQNIQNGFNNDDLLDLYTDSIPAQSSQLPLHAEHQIKSVITLANEQFSLSTRFLFSSGAGNVSNPWWGYQYFENDPFLRLNFVAHYHFKKGRKMQWSAMANIDNLLDNRYYHTGLGRDEMMTFVPQAPRRILLGVQCSF